MSCTWIMQTLQKTVKKIFKHITDLPRGQKMK